MGTKSNQTRNHSNDSSEEVSVTSPTGLLAQTQYGNSFVSNLFFQQMLPNSREQVMGPLAPEPMNNKKSGKSEKKGKKNKKNKKNKNTKQQEDQAFQWFNGMFGDGNNSGVEFVGPLQENTGKTKNKNKDKDKNKDKNKDKSNSNQIDKSTPIFDRDDYSNDEYVRETTPPFVAGYEGYAAFRVPTLVIEGKDNVYAFAEGRWDNHRDDQDCDVVMRRSNDGGKTWGDLVVVSEDGDNSVSGPAPVILPNGDLIVLYGHQDLEDKDGEHNKTMYIGRSEDGGKTWIEENVTDQVQNKDMKGMGYGAGPSQGLVKERNPNKGRIIIVAHAGSRAHLLYSDDFGQSFQIGAKMKTKSTEASVTEMGNGDLMINARSNGSEGRRVGISTDGGLSFSEERLDDGLYDRGIHSGLVFHSHNEKTGMDNLIFSNPDGLEHERTNGTLKLSMDGGKTWSKSVRYSDEEEAYSGYSNVQIINEGKDVAVIFERGGVGKDDYMDGRAVIENGTWEVDFSKGKDQLKERGKEDKRRYHMIDFKVIPIAAFFDKDVRESVENPKSDKKQHVNNDSSMGALVHK